MDVARKEEERVYGLADLEDVERKGAVAVVHDELLALRHGSEVAQLCLQDLWDGWGGDVWRGHPNHEWPCKFANTPLWDRRTTP